MRDELLAAATRHFAKKGVEGTSLQDICDEVGIRKPSLLHYFPSKEELRLAVLRNIIDHFNAVLPRLMLAATSDTGRYQAITRELVRFFEEDPDRARIVLRQGLDRPEESRALLESFVRPWIRNIAAYVRTGQQVGNVDRDLAADEYTSVVALLLVAVVGLADPLHGLLPEVPAGRPRERLIGEALRVGEAALLSPERKLRREKDPKETGKTKPRS